MSTALTVLPAAELVRQSTDIAGLCREIVLKSAMEIQGRKYVKVEGWQSIATAHGCLASSRDVQRVDGGYRAIGEVRRMSDGALLASAEGFVGEDEPTWFGGESEVWDKTSRQRMKKNLPKRPDYAIRAMCQTRAISRACRSAFAHVVVLMDAGLSTTPAEEVPTDGFHDAPEADGKLTDDPVPGMYWTQKKEHGQAAAEKWLSTAYDGARVGIRKTDSGWKVVVFGDSPQSREDSARSADNLPGRSTPQKVSKTAPAGKQEVKPGNWRTVVVHFGKKGGPLKGQPLGALAQNQLDYLRTEHDKKGDAKLSLADKKLKAALYLEFAERGAPKADSGSEEQVAGAQAVLSEGPKYNGENHRQLAESLAFANITEDDFIECAKSRGWIPAAAKSFNCMSNVTAKTFVDDFGNVQDGVRVWLHNKSAEAKPATAPVTENTVG